MPIGNHQYVCGKGKYCNANATTPQPPSTHIAESYKNAYETAFKAENYIALNKYQKAITPFSLPLWFINGTFGYKELYPGVQQPINYLLLDISNYQAQPYLFISAGSGGGSGYMYLNWIIATFGVPYEKIVPRIFYK